MKSLSTFVFKAEAYLLQKENKRVERNDTLHAACFPPTTLVTPFRSTEQELSHLHCYCYISVAAMRSFVINQAPSRTVDHLPWKGCAHAYRAPCVQPTFGDVEVPCHPPSRSLHLLVEHSHIVLLHGPLVARLRWITKRQMDESVENQTRDAQGTPRAKRSDGAMA